VLTISKPPVNALDERALDELGTVVEHLARREDIKAVVITGAGTQSFVAGADVRQLLEEMNAPEDVLPLPRKAALVTRKLESMGKPVVAAVNGVALGGGNELAMAAHYRIAETTARFGQPEINLHLLPGYGGTQRLPRLLEDKRGFEGPRQGDRAHRRRPFDRRRGRGGRGGLVDEIAVRDGRALARDGARARFILDGSGRWRRAHAARLAANDRWSKPGEFPAHELAYNSEVRRLLAQFESAGPLVPGGDGDGGHPVRLRARLARGARARGAPLRRGGRAPAGGQAGAARVLRSAERAAADAPPARARRRARRGERPRWRTGACFASARRSTRASRPSPRFSTRCSPRRMPSRASRATAIPRVPSRSASSPCPRRARRKRCSTC
jgi:acrylyl-CoA reductase (NADPH)/3-hydroxypropionyl-CoA dehydratase/3-hydroxypropionyl-CoA synthetase